MNRARLLSSFFESVETGICITDREGIILLVNDAFCSLYGYSKEELTGSLFTLVFPSEQRKKALEDYQAQFSQEKKKATPRLWQVQRKDGRNLIVSVSSFNLPLSPQEHYRVAMVKEVPEKDKSKQELLEQRNILNSLVESQTNFLIRLDTQGTFTYANKAFLSSGIVNEEISQKKFQDYLQPEDLKDWVEQWQGLLQSTHVQRRELRMRKKEGSTCWVAWEFIKLQDDWEEAGGLQGIGFDITERKKAEQERDELLYRMQALNEELQTNEEELRQNLERTVQLNHSIVKNEKKFKSLLENSFEAIILYDEAGYITYASPSVGNTLGYAAGEMVGKKGMAFIQEEDKPQTRELLAQMMEKPGSRVYILQRVKRKDGRFIWTESYNTNLLHDENVHAIVSNFRDVTERIQAEEKLRDSEATLNLAQHIANLGSAEFDLLSGEVKHSSGVYAIYDFDLDTFSEEEFNGFDYIHPEDREKPLILFDNYAPPGPEWIKALANLSEETIREVESTPFEFRIISAAGRLKYLRTKNRFIRDENGKPVKSILTLQDISEEVQRKRLLKETSRMAKTGGWELNLLTNKVNWTRQTYALFDIPSTEELTIEKATSFYLPEYQPILMTAFQALTTEGTPFDLELKMTSASKKELWVRMQGQAEMVNKKVVLAKGTMQDITNQKEAEYEVRQYAERLQMATEAAGIGIWDWDMKANKLIYDQQMRDLYAIPKDKKELKYIDFTKSLHPDDVLQQEILLQNILKIKKQETEFRIITPSGVKWIKSYAKVFDDEHGKPKRMLGLNWDNTREKETEERLRRNNEELLKTNHELDHFVYSTSHNLRAPLTSILGILNLIKNYPQGADFHTYLHLIEKSVTKLDETIQEITDYSRNTRVEVSLEPVNFEAIIEEAIESLSFLEQAEKINITYRTLGDSRFLSDSSRLKMIFTNLISNAIKYAKPEEEGPSIFILVEQQEEGVIIRIKDNGIGIAKEHQEKIFNMFFRASSKSTGSGLGLYIVKEAVHKLGGTIRVESKLGEGTEFIIFLPEPGQKKAPPEKSH